MNVRWEQLNKAQKAVVRGWYVDMPTGDQPPYPRAGLHPVIEAVWQRQRRMLETGDLLVVATRVNDAERLAKALDEMASARKRWNGQYRA